MIDPKASTSSKSTTDDEALEVGKEGWLDVGTSAGIEVFMYVSFYL